MEEIDSKEMTFEVMLSTATKGIETVTEAAQKSIVEAFKEAASQDAVSAIAGRAAMGLPYVLVTAGKVTAQHGYDALKITIAVKSGDPERVAREIFSTAMGTLAASAVGGGAALAARSGVAWAIPVGIIGAGIAGYVASNETSAFWNDTLRHTPAGQWSSHQMGNLFNLHIRRTEGAPPVEPAQASDLPAADGVLVSRLLLDPLDRQMKWIFNASKTPDVDVAASVPNYRVQQGDTLWSIARRNGWPLETLLAVNPQIQDKNFIRTGQLINRPTQSPKPDNQRSPLIQITPEPQVKQQIRHEDQNTQDVQQGYAHKTATSSVRFNHGELDSRVLQDSQRASFVTAGVRPGARQRDPNPSLAQWLAADTPIHALLKGVGVSSLAAGDRQQVAVDPLVLDMNGDGVQLTDWRHGVLFDLDNSGQQRRSGWVDSKDGLLVWDNNHDGIINDISETFSPYSPGQKSSDKRWQDGWAALAHHDDNQDGVIDNQDAIWKALTVWVDANHDGNSWVDGDNNGRLDSGEHSELHSLDELGISQLQLTTREAALDEQRGGNRLLRQGTFIRNGQAQEAWSVDFTADAVRHTLSVQDNGTLLRASLTDVLDPTVINTATTWVSHSETGETLDASELDVSHLFGSSGDDTLIARAEGSWLVGNGGRNRYVGGDGDDVLVISASDRQEDIDGGGGTNMAIFTGEGAITLNMADARIHIAEAGRGDATIISGGHTGVYMRGGEGNNLLVGGAGDDVMVGGRGSNIIIGGSGMAVIHAGPKDDVIYAAEQGSVIYLGGGHDQVLGNKGNDVIIAGTGTATIDGGEGVNVLELQGSYAQYRIEKLPDGQPGSWRISDTMAGRNGELVIKNIQRLTFDDIAAVSLQGKRAMPVTDALRVNHAGEALQRHGPQQIAAAQLLANDHRLNSEGELRIASVSEASGGSVSLSEAGDVLFVPDARYHGIMRFKYTVVDASGNPAIGVQELISGATAPMYAWVALLTPEIPDDALLAQQHYLSDARVFAAWQDGYSGRGVRIGQFEPGGEFTTGAEVFDYTHEDLAPNVDKRWLAAQKKAGSLATQFSEHATQVAGVMVAAKNHQGTTGIAPHATLAGHYLANSGNDVSGLSYLSNYDVANHSWGLKENFLLNQTRHITVSMDAAIVANIRYSAEQGRAGLGTINVTSGGNDRAKGGSAQGSYTNNHRFGIQVGAVNAAGDLSTLRVQSAPFSSPGTSLLLSAPGSQILSTSQQVHNTQGGLQGNTSSLTQGTSFSAPVASAVVALILEARPDSGYRDVQAMLAASAYHINDSHTEWRDNKATGWNGGGMHASDDYGFGHIDARAAVRLAETWLGQQTAHNLFFYEASSALPGQVAQPVVTHGLQLDPGITIEHIEVDLDLDFEQFGDAVVRLISPTGTHSLLLNRPGKIPSGMEGAKDTDVGDKRAGNLRHTFLSNHHRGEASQGEWKLEVRDATSGTPLTLNRWHLRAYGSRQTADDTYIYTDEYAASATRDSRRRVLNDAVNGIAGGRNTVNAAAVTGDVVLDLQSGRASLDGVPLTIINPASLHNLFTGDGNDSLTAGSENSVLDGGRGINHLTGGRVRISLLSANASRGMIPCITLLSQRVTEFILWARGTNRSATLP